MTDSLTEELARLNALRNAVGYGTNDFSPCHEARFFYASDEILALANKLHAENERLKALLVATRGIFKEAVDCVDNCCDCLGCSSDETLRPRVSDALAKLHAAGIGGE